ncbi:MAG TPA: hypothetical protein VEP67_09825 [Thiobacillaceae bacterium]|nr:hypothetical protein [Thiobacillaceae bacterium]
MESSQLAGDPTAVRVKRTLRLTDVQPEKLAQALRALRAMEWLSDVLLDGERIHVRYDASCVNFRDIERLLDEAGVPHPASFGWRLRSAWYRFLDSNARSHALSRGACCSKPPSR